MLTFGDLKRMTIRTLGDDIIEDGGVHSADYSSEFLADCLHASLDAILPYIWKNSKMDIEAGATSLTLPDNLYTIEAIYDNSSDVFVEMLLLSAGASAANSSGNAFMEYPEGKITFVNAIGADGGVLYYAGSWPKPESDSEAIETPRYAIPGVVMYASSYALLPRAVSSAGIRQYGSKVDSGNPEDNPLEKLSGYFYKRFEIEMARMPTRTRGVK